MRQAGVTGCPADLCGCLNTCKNQNALHALPERCALPANKTCRHFKQYEAGLAFWICAWTSLRGFFCWCVLASRNWLSAEMYSAPTPAIRPVRAQVWTQSKHGQGGLTYNQLKSSGREGGVVLLTNRTCSTTAKQMIGFGAFASDSVLHDPLLLPQLCKSNRTKGAQGLSQTEMVHKSLQLLTPASV